MNITFYYNKSAVNYLSKELVQVITLECNSYENIDIMSNTLIVDNIESVKKSNYCYNNALERYYFIKNLTILDGNRCLVECEIDVLMSYADSIRSNEGIVSKQKSLANYYLNDNEYCVESRKQIVTKKWNRDLFDVNNGSFIMKVSGG